MRLIRISLALCAALLALSAASAMAEGNKPIQIALFDPIQIFPAKESIAGLRLNLIYGKNVNMQGLDVGIVNHTTGNCFALQHGAVGYVEKDFMGWQDNVVNITRGKFTGLSTAAFAMADEGNGVMLGWVNVTKSMHGLQIGLLNDTETLHGLQIGVGNIIQKGKVPFLPIVNWSM